MNPFSLKDKVIVVTGGTGILGREFVNAIAEAGAAVGILGRNTDVAEQRAKEINDRGGQAIALTADVTNEIELQAAKEKVLNKFGKITGLVNGAGGNIAKAVVQPSEDLFNLDIQAMQQAVNLNLWGTAIPVQVFGSAIAENGAGSIVNISSVSAHQALTRVLGYSLGKSAIDSYTKWMAVELANRYGDQIRMNALMPGFFLTEQNRGLLTKEDGSFTDRGQLIIQNTPFKRMGKAEELGGTLIWLLSDASRFVSGTVIPVDGAFTAFSGV